MFRDNLISAMEKLNMSGDQLAEKSGLSRISIYGYLKGIHEPNYQSLLKICKALGTTADKLMDKENIL